MTIHEVIEMVDRLKPNQYEHETKVKWLSKLDGLIFRETLLTHAGSPIESFSGYEECDPDTELLVGFPYGEDIYTYYLQAQIDKENGELGKYNQNITLYNNAYKAFQDWYNRTHLPLPAKSAFKF